MTDVSASVEHAYLASDAFAELLAMNKVTLS